MRQVFVDDGPDGPDVGRLLGVAGGGPGPHQTRSNTAAVLDDRVLGLLTTDVTLVKRVVSKRPPLSTRPETFGRKKCYIGAIWELLNISFLAFQLGYVSAFLDTSTVLRLCVQKSLR